MRCYLAGPFFNDEQIERVQRIRDKLILEGFEVFSPMHDAGILKPDSSDIDRQKVYEENVYSISKCDFVLVITDGKDVGTMWEAGYAVGLNKPVIYFCETLGSKPFNVMLALSANGVYRSLEMITLTNIHNAIKGPKIKVFEGGIQ